MPTTSRSLNGWLCQLGHKGISVSTGKKDYGSYRLLNEPYCGKCSLPGVLTARCTWHQGDTLARTYAMGPYLHVGSKGAKSDLLSFHILGLKKFRGYSVPLGLGMSICLENIYPELSKTDIVCPVPKHPDEFKTDEKRGERYNQSSELARILADQLGMRLEDAVTKVRPYSQTNSEWKSRVNIPAGIYVRNSKVEVQNRSLLVIDDVRTSGGTLSACANALLSNGAKTVNGYVAGRDTEKGWTP